MIEVLKQALEALEQVTKELLAVRDELAERGARPTTNVFHQRLWDSSFSAYTDHAIPAAQSLRQAIREHAMYEVQRLGQEIEQEPYGWVSQHTTKGMYEWQFNKKIAGVYQDTAISILPVYTHPPQRTWQGLTIDEREQIQQECFGKVPHHVAFAHAVEAKLKEKNT